MLKTPHGPNSNVARATWSLVMFSVGGRRLAAKVEEVGGVWPWTEAIPVPSGTAFVNAVVRRGEDVLPVFDLAGKLGLQVVGPASLCLIAKQVDGPMAVRIDADLPTLQTIEETAIRKPAGADPDLVGVCVIGTGEVPIYSLATLGAAIRSTGSEPRDRARIIGRIGSNNLMPKILVADDSITVRKVAERMLTEAGFEVALAANGGEALAWLANERPDLIISDVIMPDKSGYDLCAYVRSHATLSSTPVLLISGLVDEEVTRQAESCRADGVLKKPFQRSSLQGHVSALLIKRQETSIPTTVQTPSPAPSPSPASPKAYRITEAQLLAFRQAASRIRELEAQLEAERMRSLQTAERLVETQRAVARANAMLEEMARVLAEIARVVNQPGTFASKSE